ncbi:MAG: AAA family ATPase, partial [gamma proteobacterium symbiont of Bathyaustriella thionipta]|nr:AAA family ATPase [gamma proteobacterium symbiont of Bathyaustriella thionipta]
MNGNSVNKLSSYIEALRPIIYIPTFDFNAFDGLLSQVTGETKIYEFNEGSGYVNFKTKQPETAYSIEEFLSLFLTAVKETSFLVLKDIHHHLNNPKVISLLKSIALKNVYEEDFYVTVFIVSTKLIIPVEIEKLVTVFDTPLPRTDEIVEIVNKFAKDMVIAINERLINELALSLKGFSEFEIIQILNMAYQNSGSIDKKDTALIIEEKKQIIKKSGMLEILNFNEKFDDIGGLENLKKWLQNKGVIFNRLEEAVEYGVETPKGVIIVGMPGCGKSLTAKATANLFKIPLLRLDVGKLLGKYIGESEDNMRRAINIAEAISPCVLWVDEIEKAFSGVGESGGHEVTIRLFGYFLTWMQEKNSSVFVVATSNDISRLPAEFLRRGRFDEIFLVDFPNDEERRNIIELHLKKRGQWNKDIDSITLLKETKGYSGADIEAVIKDTIEKAFINGDKKITTD